MNDATGREVELLLPALRVLPEAVALRRLKAALAAARKAGREEAACEVEKPDETQTLASGNGFVVTTRVARNKHQLVTAIRALPDTAGEGGTHDQGNGRRGLRGPVSGDAAGRHGRRATVGRGYREVSDMTAAPRPPLNEAEIDLVEISSAESDLAYETRTGRKAPPSVLSRMVAELRALRAVADAARRYIAARALRSNHEGALERMDANIALMDAIRAAGRLATETENSDAG